MFPLPPWLTGKAAQILIGLALLTALLFGVNRYNESQRNAGRQECQAAVATATVKAVQEALEEERESAGIQKAIDGKLVRDIQDDSTKKDNIIARFRDGSLKLRDTNGTCISAGPKTTGSGSGNNEASGCELSRETSEALTELANDADKVVRKLQAAQKALENDRKTVNAK